jgi:hypothetical protein
MNEDWILTNEVANQLVALQHAKLMSANLSDSIVTNVDTEFTLPPGTADIIAAAIGTTDYVDKVASNGDTIDDNDPADGADYQNVDTDLSML